MSAGRTPGPICAGRRSGQASPTACCRRRSGSTRCGREPPGGITSGRRSRPIGRTSGEPCGANRTIRRRIDGRRFRWVRFRPTCSACTTCTAMCGSRWRIVGTRAIAARPRTAAHGLPATAVRCACFAVAPGIPLIVGCGPQTASLARSATAATPTVSASPATSAPDPGALYGRTRVTPSARISVTSRQWRHPSRKSQPHSRMCGPATNSVTARADRSLSRCANRARRYTSLPGPNSARTMPPSGRRPVSRSTPLRQSETNGQRWSCGR